MKKSVLELMFTGREKIIFLLLGLFTLISSPLIAQTFVHPGIPFNNADLDQLKSNISREPWLSAYNAFKNNSRSKLSYGMQGPFATVSRAPNLNNTQWKSDMEAIHNLTFMYVFTGDSAYARKATNMLDAWAVTNTVWGGNENMLDIGDFVPYFVTAADILKSTFPGWTAANTLHVRNYFANVIYPTSWVPNPLRDCNKGAIQLQIALSVAAFLDDPVKFNQAIEVYRMDAGGGLRNSLPNGEVGDTGRDDHWFVQAQALAWGAEVAWKQGIDLFAEFDNRLLAIGELYNGYSINPNAIGPFIPYGGYSVYWTNWGVAPGIRRQFPLHNIIEGAYALRKNIATPYTTQMRGLVGEGPSTFLYLKSSDTSTASPLTPIVYPADLAQPVTHLSNIDIGNTGISGSAGYSNNSWIATGAGNNVATASNYTFKPVNGDVGMIVKVESNSISSATSGIMLRESLAANSRYVSVNLQESSMSSGASGQSANTVYSHNRPKGPWWLKLERVGNRVFTYHSHDGIHWTNNALYIMPISADAYIGIYTISNNTSALNTATFSNVGINNTSPVGSPVISSATSSNASLGAEFNYSITASHNPTIYRATNLPAGLGIDSLTGVISGTPTALGKTVIRLEAGNANGAGAAALVINVTGSAVPAAPSGVIANISNITRINISWSAVANSSSYSVKRSLSENGPFTTIQSELTGTSYIDAVPEPEVNNYYVVTSLSGELESENSNVVFASVPPAVPVRPIVVNKNNQIDLSWEVVPGALSYRVKRSNLSGGPYSALDTVSVTNYSDTDVINGNPYYYVVSAIGSINESGNSAEAFGVPGASSFTWSNTPITDSLNLAANWNERSLPVNPAIITFNASTDSILTNDITGLEVSRMQFEADASSYSIAGNSLVLKNDLVNNSGTIQRLSTPLILNSQLNVNTNTADITLSGVITGPGSLLKTGSKMLYIGGANTYTGNTIINGTTGGWPPVNGIGIAGHGTGTPSAPVSGALGTGKIIMNGGTLYSSGGDATLYNDIEITAGKRSYMYETSNALILRGKITGSGTLEHDGNTTAGFHLYGDNSEFTGTFISKLRSGNQRVRFQSPQAGSAKAHWLLDANGVDCQGIQFGTGTLHFGGLSGRGYIRANGGGSPVISIGALNTNSNFGGTIVNFINIEKVGTGTLIFTGNHTYGGTTTIKKGKFLLNNHPVSGAFGSPVIVEEGAFGGTGKSTGSATIGTGIGPGAIFEPGNEAIGTLILGSLVMKADATFQAQVNFENNNADKVITGNVQLGNAALALTGTAATLPPDAAYTIIDNTGSGAIGGTFKDLPELALLNVNGNSFRITYKGGTGNDVLLLDNRTVGVTITSALQDTALIGKPFNYTITAVQEPTLFTASGLPAGLSIDTVAGTINGTPTELGVFSVTLVASNGSSADTATLVLTVRSTVVDGVIVAAGDGKNIVEWNPVMNYSYRVKRSDTAGGPYITISEILPGTIYTDAGVTNGNVYYYVVSSTDGTGENSNSIEVAANPNIGQHDYYKFDELSGTRGTDSWGANHAVLATTATRDAGKEGQALKLDGTANSYASLPAGLVSVLNDFTISSWVRMDAKANWMRIFDFGSGTNKYLFLTIQGGTANVMRYAIKNGGAEQFVNATYNLPLNTWTHFAVTQSGNTCRLYINGVNVGTNNNINIKPSTLGVTNQNYLGKAQYPDPIFNGSIDEFRIYNRALSASEIADFVKIAQIITFNPIPQKVVGDADFAPEATASSGLPVAYTSSDTSVATIVEGKMHILNAGTTEITAIQSGDNTYNAAVSISRILRVEKKNQTITFAPIASKKAGDAGFSLAATASSNLPIGYISSNENVATVNNGILHILSPGITTITAIQLGDQIYKSASSTQEFTVLPFNLKALYADGDNGQTSNNSVRPKLKIVNEDNVAALYSELTIRYWFTPENYAGINATIDYAQIGNSKISTKYVTLPQSRDNALGYVEYSFNSSAGLMSPGSNSGAIESRIANSDWANLNEVNDYSYRPGSTYLPNNKVTLYRNGVLVWGTEPVLSAEVLALKAYSESKTSTGNTISTYLKLENSGNVAVDYKDISVRYFFTNEGDAALKYWIDYAKLGSSKVKGEFVSLNPASANADTYFEIKIDSTAGKIYPLSSTGNIQYRITKADWSAFNQSNDYSYKAGSFAENAGICIYYKGQLIFGTEPVQSNVQAVSEKAYQLSLQSINGVEDNNIIYPNPVVNGQFNVKTAADLLNKKVELKLTDLNGRAIYTKTVEINTGNIAVQLGNNVPSGIYALFLNQQFINKVIKVD